MNISIYKWMQRKWELKGESKKRVDDKENMQEGKSVIVMILKFKIRGGSEKEGGR